jgi:hypothetical protein
LATHRFGFDIRRGFLSHSEGFKKGFLLQISVVPFDDTVGFWVNYRSLGFIFNNFEPGTFKVIPNTKRISPKRKTEPVDRKAPCGCVVLYLQI